MRFSFYSNRTSPFSSFLFSIYLLVSGTKNNSHRSTCLCSISLYMIYYLVMFILLIMIIDSYMSFFIELLSRN
ncbi:hypothetical protein Hanom_Chr17g01571801 [Helianthus anomalus]